MKGPNSNFVQETIYHDQGFPVLSVLPENNGVVT
jgi:hypothetical protein